MIKENLKNKTITAEFAEYLNHTYGNVKDGNVIKQYLFCEGDRTEDVLSFIKKYYPDLWDEL